MAVKREEECRRQTYYKECEVKGGRLGVMLTRHASRVTLEYILFNYKCDTKIWANKPTTPLCSPQMRGHVVLQLLQL
jgi:hypothetical protein